MPYSRVTRTAFGADAIAYILGTATGGRGHNGHEVRNLYIGCVHMLPNEVVPFTQQMQVIWDKASERHTTQINRYVISFGLDELDPNEPRNWGIAGAIGEEFAQTIAPDNQSIITVQDDGKGEKLHVHIDINDGRISDGKGIDAWTYHHQDFKPIVDRICEQYFDLAKPDKHKLPEKVNHFTQNARDRNEQIRAANEQEKKLAEEEGREAELVPEKYIWTDDLRERIKAAAATATDEEDFAHQLRLSGVELVPCKNRKTDEILKNDDGSIKYLHPGTKRQPEYYTYELVDTTGFPGKLPMNLKLKSHRMGTNYSPETLAELFAKNAKDKLHEKTASDTLEVPMPFSSAPKKVAPKSTATTKKISNAEAVEEAKEHAANHILFLMQQIYGWQQSPKIIKSDGEEHLDIDEWTRQLQARDDTFSQFTEWRKAQAKNGKKLPAIYSNNKETGEVSYIRSELETQFLDFLDRRDHPEKYIVAQEQPNDQPKQIAPMAQHQEEQQQQPAPVEPTPTKQQQAEPETTAEAEQEQQETPAQYSALFREVQRINAANEKRWKEKEGEEEDTIVKS